MKPNRIPRCIFEEKCPSDCNDATLQQQEAPMTNGYVGRVLEIDLASESISFKPIDEEITEIYIGGQGYDTRLQRNQRPRPRPTRR